MQTKTQQNLMTQGACSLKKINEIVKPLARQTRKRREKFQIELQITMDTLPL